MHLTCNKSSKRASDSSCTFFTLLFLCSFCHFCRLFIYFFQFSVYIPLLLVFSYFFSSMQWATPSCPPLLLFSDNFHLYGNSNILWKHCATCTANIYNKWFTVSVAMLTCSSKWHSAGWNSTIFILETHWYFG